MNRKKQKRDVRIKKARRKAVICGVCVAAAAFLVIIFINSILRRTLEQYEPDIIIDGVFIGATDVSGMTAEEAEAAVEADTEQISGELIIFDLGDGREARATLKELGLSVKELDKIIGQAVDYGKMGRRVEAYKILKASEEAVSDPVSGYRGIRRGGASGTHRRSAQQSAKCRAYTAGRRIRRDRR